MRNGFKFIAIIIAIFAFVEYYCYVALSNSINTFSKPARTWTISIYIVLSLLGWVSLFWLRYFSNHHFPQNVKAIILAAVMGFVVAKLVIALFMFIGDLVIALRYLLAQFSQKSNEATDAVTNGAKGISRSKFLAQSAFIAGGLMFGGLLWGIGNRYRYHVKRIKLSIKNLPEALKGMTILQISDVHSGSFDNHKAVAHGIDLIQKQNADLIVFTGDLVNDKATEIVPFMDIFGKLKAPLGVYSTLGNHDYGDYTEWPSEQVKRQNLETLKEHHASMGWRLMMNEHQILNRNGQDFALIGVENWSASSRFPKHGRLKEAYAGLEDKAMFKLLLSHDPSHWDAEIRVLCPDIDLTLSGHTHGMQFGIDLPWLKWSPIQYAYKEWAGLYKEAEQYLYVNRGFGFLGYQGRLGILPEITVIELA